MHKRFSRRASKGIWEEVFERLLKEPKNDYMMIDSTLVNAHQQAAGRSRGELNPKIHLLCDALGRPLRFMLTAGQKAHCCSAEGLLAGQWAGTVTADKGYETNAICALIAAARRMQAVILSCSNRSKPIPYDQELYKARNLIERCFGKLKQHRRIAARFDRNYFHFMGFLFLGAALLRI